MSQELNVLGPFTPYGLFSVPSPSGDSLIHGSEARYFLFESEASEHRLDKTALGYSTRDEAYQSKVGLGADGVFAAVNAEEEILVHQNTVVWSSGGCVRKSFTLSRPIIQAMLVSFDMAPSRMEDSTDKPSYASDLCVLHSEGLSVFCADGKTFSVVTPFEMEKMWPLPTGLLLQRAPSNAHQTVAPIQGLSVKTDEEDAPTLFSLLHPLEDIRPISYLDHRSTLASSFVPTPAPSTRTPKHHTPKTPGNNEVNLESQLKELKHAQPEDSHISRFICNPHLRLIYSSAEVPLLVLYNTQTLLHSIWLIRKAPKVVESFPSPLDSLDPLLSPDPQSHHLDSFQSSFQDGYTRDLSWGPEKSAPRTVHSDLRLEHLYTEIPRIATDPKIPRTKTESGVLYEGSAPATQVFLIVTPDAHLRLGFMLTEQKVLHLYQLSSEEDEDVRNSSFASLGSSDASDSDPSIASTLKVTKRRTLPCLAAIPLRVVDPLVLRVANKNIRLCPSYLVLELDRKIAIYSMNDRISECILPESLFMTGSEPLKTPPLKSMKSGTPIIHRTPSSSHLLHIRHLKQSSAMETPSNLTGGNLVTPARSLLSRGFGSSRKLVQSPIVFSPMTPGSPFPASSDMDISISALDLDMSIDQILLQASPATPMRPPLPHRSTTLGSIVLDTPAKSNSAMFATPGLATSSNLSASRLDFEEPSGTHVVDILQPVSNRFSVLFNDGRVYRLSLKIAPSSPVVLDCFRAATSLLTHTVWNALLSEYLAFKHKLKHTGLGEFELFSLFLKALLPITPELVEQEISKRKKASVAPDVLIDVDDSDWNFLLNSTFHATKMGQAPYQVLPTATDLFSTTDTTHSSSSKSSKSDSSSSDNSSSKFICFVSRLKECGVSLEQMDGVLQDVANWHRRPKANALRPFLSSLIHTTHLLCENYKLSMLTVPLSRQLGGLLLDLAVMQGWQDYAHFYAHWLDVSLSPSSFPAASLSGGVSTGPRLEQPPSILDWIRRCLVGFRETFPIMRESNQPCELTRKICRLYHILVHGPPQESDDIETYFEPFSSLPITLGARMNKTPRTSPIKSAQLKSNQQLKWNVRARLTVVAMDEEFADLASLDSLPYGIALPLREAIHSVKYHPPTNWPLSCYRFIGREDLAMQGLSFQKVAKSKYSIQDPYLSSSNISFHNIQSSQANPAISSNENGLESILHAPHHPSSNGSSDPNSASASGSAAGGNSGDSAESESGYDGTELTSPATLMRFSQDERLGEVSRLLRSSYVLQLVATEEISHQSEAVQVHESYQKQMLSLVMRLLSLPIGRGMFTLSAELDHWGNAELDRGVYDELEDARDAIHAKQVFETKTAPTAVLKACARAEPLVVPHLPLKARRPDDRSIMTVERLHPLVDWPEFHNGVAAGLRVPPSDAEPISWQWIVSNRPKGALSCAHAGFLLAMGLQGHLKHIDPTGLYDYLSLVHPYTSASLLVGYASCVYGMRSSLLSKVLQIHLPKPKRSVGGYAEPVAVEEMAEVQVHPMVQCAALVSAGLGFAETNQRHHVETLLSLLQHPHYNGTCTESLGLASGIGLGFVCLAQGNNANGLADLDILNRLCACMEGSKTRSKERSMEASLETAHLVNTARTATGMIDVLVHNPTFAPNLLSHQSRPSQTAALPIYIGPFDHGVPARKPKAINTHPSEKVEIPVLVRHEPGIDKEVSAAGAAIALGLIFLKTNNRLAAGRVALPHNNPASLAFIRPDVQLQRTLSKCLIMWDEIQPTQSWWEAQFPVGCLAIGQTLLGPAWKRDPIAEKQDSFQLLKTAYMMVMAGASMALGLRFAGSSNQACIALLAQNLNQMLKVQKSMSDRMDKKAAETSILQIVLARSLVQAGTGDLDLLRILRKLRKKLGIDAKFAEGIYGYQMAIGMAIGFLFLGGGRYSISTSNKAIAALVTSLYSLWPLVPADDKYHLPLLRHLYMLAIEPRCLEARDVDLLTPQYVPVRFWVRSTRVSDPPSKPQTTASKSGNSILKNSTSDAFSSVSSATLPSFGSHEKQLTTANEIVEILEMTTPCLMPPREQIVKIEIFSPHYWRAAFRPNHNKLHEHMLRAQNFVLVKKRHGSLQQAQQGMFSPIPHQPVLSAAQLKLIATDASETHLLNFSQTFEGDPMLAALANFLLSETSSSRPSGLDSGSSELEMTQSIRQWQSDVFQDQETLKLLRCCADEDKEKLIQTLLWLRRYAIGGLSTSSHAPSISDQLNVDMILLFYDAGIVDDYEPPLAIIDTHDNSEMSLLQSFSTIGSSLGSLAPGQTQSRSDSGISSKSSSSHSKRNLGNIPPLISPSLLQFVRSAHSIFQKTNITSI